MRYLKLSELGMVTVAMSRPPDSWRLPQLTSTGFLTSFHRTKLSHNTWQSIAIFLWMLESNVNKTNLGRRSFQSCEEPMLRTFWKIVPELVHGLLAQSGKSLPGKKTKQKTFRMEKVTKVTRISIVLVVFCCCFCCFCCFLLLFFVVVVVVGGWLLLLLPLLFTCLDSRSSSLVATETRCISWSMRASTASTWRQTSQRVMSIW